jgi:hypothetical protein
MPSEPRATSPRSSSFVSEWRAGAPLIVLTCFACSASGNGEGDGDGSFGGSGGSAAAAGGGAGGGAGSAGSAGTGGNLTIDGGASGGSGGGEGRDPATCEEAALNRTYLGCEFWPTVTLNQVWSIFDYAVVVANGGAQEAEVSVIRGGREVARERVPANGLKKVFLPWVPELKGPDQNECGVAFIAPGSRFVPGGAYRLTSSAPVTVYQFNALEYKPAGGPPGKDWSSCPGRRNCFSYGGPIGCFSYTNDASLLLPTTALTGNYRVAGLAGGFGQTVSITATSDGTSVTFSAAGDGAFTAGQGVSGGERGNFAMRAGDVVQLGAEALSDLSGSLVQATKPVQVIVGNGCIAVEGKNSCDHIEESVLPAETLGSSYVVAPPTGPQGRPVGHLVRLVGNVAGTRLTWSGERPTNAPDVLDAGQVVDLGVTSSAFVVSGDHEFQLTGFLQGGSVVDPAGSLGDPSQTFYVTPSQFRRRQVFLAPDDYVVAYADVVAPAGTTISLDGATPREAPVPVADGWTVLRAKLGPGAGGTHVLEASAPVGVQVVGYGQYTSYHYPAGLNLDLIAEPPPVVE